MDIAVGNKLVAGANAAGDNQFTVAGLDLLPGAPRYADKLRFNHRRRNGCLGNTALWRFAFGQQR